ncbi:MAG: hypothetical protein ACTSYC_06205 [Promethearchaeota archaeon]
MELKGILILGYHEEAGSAIVAQYPPDLLNELDIPESRILTIFEQTANKRGSPQFTQVNISKDTDMLELYTGSSKEFHIGIPDYGIVVLISSSDTISREFEGMIRRIAHNLLPQINEASFRNVLKDYFELLENEELSPYWKEDSFQEVKQEASEAAISSQESDENELRKLGSEEIELMVEKITEQGEKIKDLSKYIIQMRTEKNEMEEKVLLLEKKIDLQKATIQELNEEKNKLESENGQLKDTISNLTRKIEELSKEIEGKEKEIEKLTTDLKEKDKLKELIAEMEVLKSENETFKQKMKALLEEKEQLNGGIRNLSRALETLKEENNLHLDAMTSMKMEIKNLKDMLSAKEKERDSREEEIIELKKEIKVLRRERDHYKEIIKKNKLL